MTFFRVACYRIFAVLTAASLAHGASSAAAAIASKPAIQWVSIPGGTFMMGLGAPDAREWAKARPIHWVSVKSFQMAKTLVTNKQYKACVEAGACTTAHSYGPEFEAENQPVVGVDWNQAKAFAAWAGGRLPTEAEWEYAARSGGRNQKNPWGDEDASCSLAVVSDCGGVTVPVCSKPAGNTRQGLCDMAGNVWEWVQDRFYGSYNGAPTDGRAWEAPEVVGRVIRGGSWFDYAVNARSSSRSFYDENYRDDLLGFRPAR